MSEEEIDAGVVTTLQKEIRNSASATKDVVEKVASDVGSVGLKVDGLTQSEATTAEKTADEIAKVRREIKALGKDRMRLQRKPDGMSTDTVPQESGTEGATPTIEDPRMGSADQPEDSNPPRPEKLDVFDKLPTPQENTVSPPSPVSALAPTVARPSVPLVRRVASRVGEFAKRLFSKK